MCSEAECLASWAEHLCTSSGPEERMQMQMSSLQPLWSGDEETNVNWTDWRGLHLQRKGWGEKKPDVSECFSSSWKEKAKGVVRIFVLYLTDGKTKAEEKAPLSFFLFYLFIWLSMAFIACKIFSCSLWDLVLWPGIEPGPPTLGAQNLSHWTIRNVPRCHSSGGPLTAVTKSKIPVSYEGW